MRNWTLFNRNVWMDETVEHVCKGFLGLTMNCAKCHDHKFDPIAQIDYYRMRAFFEPYQVRTDMVPGEPDLTRDGIPRVFDGPLDVPTYRFERGQESQPDKSKVITPGVPKFLSFREIEIQSVSLPNGAWQPERRPWVLESYIKACRKNLASAEATVSVARKKLELAESQLRNSHDVSAADKKSREFAVAAVADANAELDADEVAVVATRAELFSVERRAAAMRAAWTRDAEKGEANLANYERTMAVEAVKAERRATAAKARQIVADAELHLSRAAADAKGSAKNELTAAREAHKKAEQKAAAPIEPADHYTPLVGAKWSATRNMLSTKDDPAIEFPDHSTGRRKALAAWITDRRNPLTARVAVNHIWTRHLGTPLVPTVFDFGRKGTPPTHPELLDWLASEFIDSGWDMKHLHRLIVTSSTYRMSSAATSDANLAKDPDNLRLWHRPPIRLESEAVRDSILSLAGRLDLTRGGPPVLSAAQAKSNRRSLYFFHSNNDRDLFLTTFDEALVKECYRRDQSIVPQQALALCNSGLVLDAAKQVAERLSQPTATAGIPPDDREFVRKAFYVILGIRASGDEIGASLKALEAWRKLPNKPTGRSGDLARQHFVWALFNHNDFVTVR